MVDRREGDVGARGPPPDDFNIVIEIRHTAGVARTEQVSDTHRCLAIVALDASERDFSNAVRRQTCCAALLFAAGRSG